MKKNDSNVNVNAVVNANVQGTPEQGTPVQGAPMGTDSVPVTDSDVDKVLKHLKNVREQETERFRKARKRLQDRAKQDVSGNVDVLINGFVTGAHKQAKEKQKSWREKSRSFMGCLRAVWQNFASTHPDDKDFRDGLLTLPIYSELSELSGERDRFVNRLREYMQNEIDPLFVRTIKDPVTGKESKINGFPGFKTDEKTKQYVYNENGDLIPVFVPWDVWDVNKWLKMINKDIEIKALKRKNSITEQVNGNV